MVLLLFAFLLATLKHSTADYEYLYGADGQQMPMPYSYSYQAPVGNGPDEGQGLITAQESGDESGVITGQYYLKDPDGRMRTVIYRADENGFQATVKTNEPGTANENPADVVMMSSATVPSAGDATTEDQGLALPFSSPTPLPAKALLIPESMVLMGNDNDSSGRLKTTAGDSDSELTNNSIQGWPNAGLKNGLKQLLVLFRVNRATIGRREKDDQRRRRRVDKEIDPKDDESPVLVSAIRANRQFGKRLNLKPS